MNIENEITGLETLAKVLKYPLSFESRNNNYTTRRRAILLFGEKTVDALHTISFGHDGKVGALCTVHMPENTCWDAVESLATALRQKAGLVFSYDKDLRHITTGVIEVINCKDNGAIEAGTYFLERYVLTPLRLIRIFYNSYILMMLDGKNLEDAIRDAETEAEENGMNFSCQYRSISGIIADKGERYYIENEMLSGYFRQTPAGCINVLSSKDRNCACTLLRELCDKSDIYPLPDFSEVKVKHWNAGKKMSCIRLLMPEATQEGDCSDIILISSCNGAYYFTIAAQKLNGPKSEFFSVQCRDYSAGNCVISDFGTFRSRTRSVMKCMRIARALDKKQ